MTAETKKEIKELKKLVNGFSNIFALLLGAKVIEEDVYTTCKKGLDKLEAFIEITEEFLECQM